MLCSNAIGEQPLLAQAQGTPTPYAIDIDDSSEIDLVTLVILTVFIDPTIES